MVYVPKHLRAGLVSLLVLAFLVAGGRIWLDRWTGRYQAALAALAVRADDEVVKGLTLTQQAIRQKEMLVLMGSSELTFRDEYHVANIFDTRPTGFGVHLVGSGYRQSVHNLMALSALGEALRDRPVVMFISPTWFTRHISTTAYKKNFSALQAYELAYTAPLSPGLKQRAAQRLLSLGSPGTDDPILHASLAALSRGDLPGRLAFGAVWPLGRVRLEFLRVSEQIGLLRLVHTHQGELEEPAGHPARKVNWDQLLTRAEQDARNQSTTNQFGIANGYYTKHIEPRLEKLRDSDRTERWMNSTEWGDLDLVLDTLRELGARPLFLSVPVMGKFYDFRGHPVADRQAYYVQVRERIERAGFPVVDFSAHDNELGFMRDPWHPGWKGSVYIARTLDDFYHGRLSAAPR